MNKCILTLDGHMYEEYSFYSVGRDIPSDGLIYSASIIDVYENATAIKKRCTKVPKPGDKLWIAPDCIISRDDVRKEYKIKRKAEDADFRVMSEKKYHKDIGYFSQFIVSRASKTIVALDARETNHSIDTPSKVYTRFHVPIDSVDAIVSTGCYLYYIKDTEGVYSDLITGKGTPIVHHSQVPLTKSLPVTLDTLTVLQTACDCRDTSENMHALILQLQALNQCDWHKYIYTLRNFFQRCNDGWFAVFGSFKRKRSSWPAGIKQMCNELLCSRIGPCDNKEDFELYKSWVKKRLGVTSDTAVLSLEKYKYLLLSKRVNQSEIDTLYNCTIRITPKIFQ